MDCRGCGRANRGGAAFCDGCGSKLVAAITFDAEGRILRGEQWAADDREPATAAFDRLVRHHVDYYPTA
jgi:hypothetical protein